MKNRSVKTGCYCNDLRTCMLYPAWDPCGLGTEGRNWTSEARISVTKYYTLAKYHTSQFLVGKHRYRDTEKGTITIPVEVRRKLGLTKWSRVDFAETDDGVLILPVISFEELKGIDRDKEKTRAQDDSRNSKRARTRDRRRIATSLTQVHSISTQTKSGSQSLFEM